MRKVNIMAAKEMQKEAQSAELTDYQKSIFVKYYQVVAKVVNSMRSKLPAYADIDELHSAGVAGLADAVRRVDSSRSDSFDGYIAMRIRGAIIDELRNIDYMSRSARNDAKNVEKIRTALEQKLSRAPRNDELRSAMGVSVRQFSKIMRRTQVLSFISLNDSADSSDGSAPSFSESVADENAKTPLDTLEASEMGSFLRRQIKTLPDKQRRVIDSYYFQEKKLSENAKDFGLTEARICQIHSQALSNLRPKLQN